MLSTRNLQFSNRDAQIRQQIDLLAQQLSFVSVCIEAGATRFAALDFPTYDDVPYMGNSFPAFISKDGDYLSPPVYDEYPLDLDNNDVGYLSRLPQVENIFNLAADFENPISSYHEPFFFIAHVEEDVIILSQIPVEVSYDWVMTLKNTKTLKANDVCIRVGHGEIFAYDIVSIPLLPRIPPEPPPPSSCKIRGRIFSTRGG